MNMIEEIQKLVTKKPSDQEMVIFNLLTSREGEEFLSWLKQRTIEKQIGLGVQDGVQTAILTARELGRSDIYHEVNRLIVKISSYVNRK